MINFKLLMTKSISVIFFLLFLAMASRSQDLSASRLVGKWGICQSLDTISKDCPAPYNFYIFNSDGTCQHGEVTSMDEKIPVTGRWRIVNGNVEITYDRHPGFLFPSQTFPNIQFLNDRLFYYKLTGEDEAPGRWIFFTLKKL